jgi:protein gp37
MKQVLWTPTFDDGSIRNTELDRPTDTDEPTAWEVPLFHGGATVGDIAAVFGIMAGCPRHTFRVLVQDVAAMADWFSWVEGFEHVDPVSVCEIEAANRTDVDQLAPSWPLPNVTLVSPIIRTQAEADRVLPALLAVKAARREAVFAPTEVIGVSGLAIGVHAVRVRGGETPMHPAWVRALRDQAVAGGVPFSLAWGEWVPIGQLPASVPFGDAEMRCPLGRIAGVFAKTGGARSGCSLDGVEYPEEP